MAFVEENTLASGGTSYTIRWRDASGGFKRKTIRNKREAERFALRVENELADGNSTEALVKNGRTFREVAEAYVAANPDHKYSTRRNDEMAYRLHILPMFGDKRVARITSLDVEAWLADLRTKKSERTGKPLSPKTVHNTYVTLNKTFKYAVRHGLIGSNPCSVLDKPKVPREERGFLQPDQVRSIARALDKSAPYGLIVRFAAYTGLREGELAALRIGDVSILHKVVRVRRTVRRVKGGWLVGTPKTARSSRDVPLSRALREELQEYLAEHPRRSDPNAALWPGRHPGTKGDARGLDYDRQFDIGSLVRYYFQPACKAQKLTGVRWHDLRHFYASLCAAAGYDIRQVSRWMGHANINTTDSIYTHLFNGTHDMDALDAAAATGSTASAPLARIG